MERLHLRLSGQLNPETLGFALPDDKNFNRVARPIAPDDADKVRRIHHGLTVYSPNHIVGLQSGPRRHTHKPKPESRDLILFPLSIPAPRRTPRESCPRE